MTLAALLLAFALPAAAACSRADVEFYLGKGFTPEQITTLCAGEAEKKPATLRSDDEMELLVGIKGYAVTVGTASIGYTREECVEYGEEDMYGFRKKVCPKRRYTIGLKGLKVLRGRRSLFFRRGTLRVQGAIERRILSGMDGLDQAESRLAAAVLETGDQTVIPIREDILPKRIGAILKKMAR